MECSNCKEDHSVYSKEDKQHVKVILACHSLILGRLWKPQLWAHLGGCDQRCQTSFHKICCSTGRYHIANNNFQFSTNIIAQIIRRPMIYDAQHNHSYVSRDSSDVFYAWWYSFHFWWERKVVSYALMHGGVIQNLVEFTLCNCMIMIMLRNVIQVEIRVYLLLRFRRSANDLMIVYTAMGIKINRLSFITIIVI